jgi:pimeloyl-ACP methyl ester carboxylesterase
LEKVFILLGLFLNTAKLAQIAENTSCFKKYCPLRESILSFLPTFISPLKSKNKHMLLHHTHYAGKKQAWFKHGQGPCIVLLHGFCENHRIWADYYKPLAQQGYQVLGIDLPGFGQSETLERASIAEMAAAVKTILDAEKLEQVIMIGHSMGGYVALEFAAAYPDRLLGFGLFHSHPYVDSPEKKAGRYQNAEKVLEEGSHAFVSRLYPGLFPPNWPAAHPAEMSDLIEQGSHLSPEGIAYGLRCMADRRDHTDTLTHSKVPVLFIVGLEDPLQDERHKTEPPSLPAVAMVHFLPGVGHMGMLEAFAETLEIVGNFSDFCKSRLA